MWKKATIGVLVLVLLLAVGGYFFLSSLVSDDLVRPTLERVLTDALGQPVRVGRAHLSFLPRLGIELTDVTLGEPARVRLGAIRLATGLGPLLGRRIEHAEVIVERGEIDLPLLPLGGGAGAPEASGAIPAEPSGESAVTLVSIDTIALRDIQVKGGDRTLVVNLETSLAADRLEITRLSARADQTTIEGTGAITDLSRYQGTLDLKANDLDVDRLMVFLSSFTSEDAGPAARPSTAAPDARLVVTLAAPTGRLAGVGFTDLKARATVAPPSVVLEPLTFGIFGGKYDGRLALDVSGPVPAFAWQASLAGVNVADVLTYAGAAGVMTGTLSGRAQVKGTGADAAEAMKALVGTGRIEVRDGTLPTLRLVETAVNAFGKKAEQPPAGSGEAFSTLSGSFTLASGVMTTHDLALDSRDVDLDGAGTVRLEGAALDLRGNLRLSEDASKRLGSGLSRYAGEGGRVVLPATVRGPAAQPTVMVDAGAAAKRAITNEMNRQLEKGIGSLFKKKKGGE